MVGTRHIMSQFAMHNGSARVDGYTMACAKKFADTHAPRNRDAMLELLVNAHNDICWNEKNGRKHEHTDALYELAGTVSTWRFGDTEQIAADNKEELRELADIVCEMWEARVRAPVTPAQ